MKLLLAALIQLAILSPAFGAGGDTPKGSPSAAIPVSMIPYYESQVGFVDCAQEAVENRLATQNSMIALYKTALRDLDLLISQAELTKNNYAVERLKKERLEIQINRTRITSEIWTQRTVCELKLHGNILP